MIQKIKNGLKKRKVKVFALFLLCSGLAWFINNLSESYRGSATFNLKYVNLPDDFLLTDTSKDKIDVRLEAVGFQFLRFNFVNKTIRIDLSTVENSGSKFFMPAQTYTKQIEKQLSNAMKLVDIDKDTLFFELQKLNVQNVPVKPRIQLNLAQNYLLDGDLVIEPDTVRITGPKNEIDTITRVQTLNIDLRNLTTDFSRTIELDKPTALNHTTFSSKTVTVKGKVSRFSEKIIEIPVDVINLPVGIEIRTFPDKISILCKAKVDQLKRLRATDFRMVVDYDETHRDTGNTLQLKLHKRPDDIHSVTFEETQVEYILKRK